MTKEQKSISNHNKYLAWKHFYPEGNGKPKKGHVLHHVDITLRHSNVERYILWLIEDLVLMSLSEHSKLHNSGKNNPFFGKHFSEEARRKISETKKGKPNPHKGPSEEVRKKISEALKGRCFSEERKRKLSEARKGHFVSEETKRKMSASHQGHFVSDETKRKISEAAKRRYSIK